MQQSPPSKQMSPKPNKDLPFHLLVRFWEQSMVKGSKNEMITLFQNILDRYKQYNLSIYPLLRLTLPYLDFQRIYNIKEDSLAKMMIQVLQIPETTIDAKRLMNWKTDGRGDLPAVIEDVADGRAGVTTRNILTVSEVNDFLSSLYQAKDKKKEFYLIINAVSPRELKWICKIVLKKLRAKYKEDLIFPLIHPNADKIFATNPSLEVLAKVFRGEMPVSTKIQAGNMTLPMLSMRTNLERLRRMYPKGFPENNPWYVEIKYDGSRFQAHKDGKKWKFFTRGNVDVTQKYAKIIPQLSMALKPDVKSVVLDGELLVWKEEIRDEKGNVIEEGHLEPFSQISSYTAGNLPEGRHYFYMIFDVLYLNGVDVSQNRLKRRRLFLKRDVLKSEKPTYVEISKVSEVQNIDEVEELFQQAMENEEEGIMLKNSTSYYVPGSRNKEWWMKLKPDYEGGLAKDVDLLVLGGFYGEGKRGGNLASFLLGVIDEKQEGLPISYKTASKVGSGLKEDMLQFLTAEMEQSKVDEKPLNVKVGLQATKDETPDFWIDPQEGRVFRVNAAQIILSEKFATGVVFRNPRVEEIRFDKGFDEAMDKNELDELIELAPEGIRRQMKKEEKKLKKPKGRPLVMPRKATETKGVEVKSDLFKGLTFGVYLKELGEKERMERAVYMLNGEFLQYGNPERFTHIITDEPDILALTIMRKYVEDKHYRQDADYEEMNVDEMKEILKKRRDKMSGNREQLLERLYEGDKVKIRLAFVKPKWVKDSVEKGKIAKYTEENSWWHYEPKERVERVRLIKKEKEVEFHRPVKKVRKGKGKIIRSPPKTIEIKSPKSLKLKENQKPAYSPPKVVSKREEKRMKTPPQSPKMPSPKKPSPKIPSPKMPSPKMPSPKMPSKTKIPSPQFPKVSSKTNDGNIQYSTMLVKDLKKILAERNLATSGKKDDLIKRLKANDKKQSNAEKIVSSVKEQSSAYYSTLLVKDLKKILEQKNLSTTGRKADLIKRLQAFDKAGAGSVQAFDKASAESVQVDAENGKVEQNIKNYEKMKNAELIDILKSRGLPYSKMKKADMVKRLKEDDMKHKYKPKPVKKAKTTKPVKKAKTTKPVKKAKTRMKEKEETRVIKNETKSREELMKYTNKELIEMLKKEDRPTWGAKAKLVERLLQH